MDHGFSVVLQNVCRRFGLMRRKFKQVKARVYMLIGCGSQGKVKVEE